MEKKIGDLEDKLRVKKTFKFDKIIFFILQQNNISSLTSDQVSKIASFIYFWIIFLTLKNMFLDNLPVERWDLEITRRKCRSY